MKNLRNLSELQYDDIEKFAYIPILDNNPTFAARFLTVEDTRKSYDLLVSVFTEIAKGNNKVHPLMFETVLFCEHNFLWYSTFLKELEDILNVKPHKISFEKCPAKYSLTSPNLRGKIKKCPPAIYHPFACYFSARKRAFVAEYLKQNIASNKEVDNYRLKYLSEGYHADDFQDCTFPAWYSLETFTIYENYNEWTNTRVRIDYDSGKFLYYIAGASDNWKKVTDFEDIDKVVSVLIYKRQLKNYY